MLDVGGNLLDLGGKLLDSLLNFAGNLRVFWCAKSSRALACPNEEPKESESQKRPNRTDAEAESAPALAPEDNEHLQSRIMEALSVMDRLPGIGDRALTPRAPPASTGEDEGQASARLSAIHVLFGDFVIVFASPFPPRPILNARFNPIFGCQGHRKMGDEASRSRMH